VCQKAKLFIDFHGSVIAKHLPDRGFNFKKFVLFLAEQFRMKWGEIYWRLKAFSSCLPCDQCGEHFPGA